MANQDFTRKNKKPTTHDKQKRLAEEELEKRISRLQLAIKKEKDPKLKQEISLLLQQYETEHKNLLQKTFSHLFNSISMYYRSNHSYSLSYVFKRQLSTYL